MSLPIVNYILIWKPLHISSFSSLSLTCFTDRCNINWLVGNRPYSLKQQGTGVNRFGETEDLSPKGQQELNHVDPLHVNELKQNPSSAETTHHTLPCWLQTCERRWDTGVFTFLTHISCEVINVSCFHLWAKDINKHFQEDTLIASKQYGGVREPTLTSLGKWLEAAGDELP
jgi:hypothetical protein